QISRGRALPSTSRRLGFSDRRTQSSRQASQRRDGKIPHVDQDGLQALLNESKKRSTKRNHYTTHFRDLGGLIRCSGDLAVAEDAPLITAKHVAQAINYSSTLDEQQKQQNA
ncbi:MAG: AAA family ATPase, partial [Verrucomicrobiales bacterium]|nr:AAA family ATPase [Verrucomicrobiales bacterium]